MDISRLTFAGLVLEKETRSLSVGHKNCTLSYREYQLMAFLMQNPRMYFSADALLDRVWGMAAEVEQGTVWTHISYLRSKLDALDAHAVIRSERGFGYALEEKE